MPTSFRKLRNADIYGQIRNTKVHVDIRTRSTYNPDCRNAASGTHVDAYTQKYSMNIEKNARLQQPEMQNLQKRIS